MESPPFVDHFLKKMNIDFHLHRKVESMMKEYEICIQYDSTSSN